MNAPVDNSYGTVEICVKIDSSFQPKNANTWFNCSTIFGCELPNPQRDWAVIIDKNGCFAIGYGNTSIYSSNIPVKDGKIHTVSYSYLQNKLLFSIDGELITQIDFTGTGIACKQFGIGYNKDSGTTAIRGNIYSVRFYNRELSTEELKLNYNSDKTRFGIN